MYLIFFTFSILLTIALIKHETRAKVLERDYKDWAIDVSGLLMQGIIIPALQTFAIWSALNLLVPQYSGILKLGAVSSFLLNFILVDYAYYWNHRILHSKSFWKTHIVHHSSLTLDPIATSRNTLWTPFLIIYIWANGIFIFLIAEPKFYLASVAITAALDLWRHSNLSFNKNIKLLKFLSYFLITPENHAWHHSKNKYNVNFGANLNIWDRIHGTYYNSSSFPPELGVDLSTLGFWEKLLFPFSYQENDSPSANKYDN